MSGIRFGIVYPAKVLPKSMTSLLGVFSSDDMVTMGVGVKQLGMFNKMTLVGLFDIKSISTLTEDTPDYAFVWKLVVLAAVAVVCYVVGAVRFYKKDLPL